MPRLTQQAESLYHRLAIARAKARNAGDAEGYMRIVAIQDAAHDRYERRKAKCDYCSKPFEPDERVYESHTFGNLCSDCHLICECW